MDEPEFVTRSIRFPADLYQWVTEQAALTDRSMSRFVVHVLRLARDAADQA